MKDTNCFSFTTMGDLANDNDNGFIVTRQCVYMACKDLTKVRIDYFIRLRPLIQSGVYSP